MLVGLICQQQHTATFMQATLTLIWYSQTLDPLSNFLKVCNNHDGEQLAG